MYCSPDNSEFFETPCIFIHSMIHKTGTNVPIDDYAKDGGPDVVWHLCGFYQDPLRS